MLVGRNLIGDVAVAPALGVAVIDPATGGTVCFPAQGSLADADVVVARAIAVARDRGQAARRQDALRRAAAAIEDGSDEIARLLTTEQSGPVLWLVAHGNPDQVVDWAECGPRPRRLSIRSGVAGGA